MISGEFVKDNVQIAGINIEDQVFGITFKEEGFAFNNVLTNLITYLIYLI